MKPKGRFFYVEHQSGHVISNRKFILPRIPFPPVANSNAMERHSSAKYVLLATAKASNHQWFSGSLRPNISEMVKLQLARRLQKSLHVFSSDVAQGAIVPSWNGRRERGAGDRNLWHTFAQTQPPILLSLSG